MGQGVDLFHPCFGIVGVDILIIVVVDHVADLFSSGAEGHAPGRSLLHKSVGGLPVLVQTEESVGVPLHQLIVQFQITHPASASLVEYGSLL
ncbi:hypothetical protein D3C75_795780 [compost metagenome]